MGRSTQIICKGNIKSQTELSGPYPHGILKQCMHIYHDHTLTAKNTLPTHPDTAVLETLRRRVSLGFTRYCDHRHMTPVQWGWSGARSDSLIYYSREGSNPTSSPHPHLHPSFMRLWLTTASGVTRQSLLRCLKVRAFFCFWAIFKEPTVASSRLQHSIYRRWKNYSYWDFLAGTELQSVLSAKFRGFCDSTNLSVEFVNSFHITAHGQTNRL